MHLFVQAREIGSEISASREENYFIRKMIKDLRRDSFFFKEIHDQ